MITKRYDRSVLEQHPAFEIAKPSAELLAKTEAVGWPDGLLSRALALRTDQAEINIWLDNGFPTTAMIKDWVTTAEHLASTTLNVRMATWADGYLISDLCHNSPETVGDWQVVVERGPNAYAQFRLQEHPYVVIAADDGVALGIVSRSIRNTCIGGERTTAHFISGWRVREGFRGMGISKLLMQAPGPGTSWFALASYWYVRIDNADKAWVDKVTSDMTDRPEGWAAGADQLTATITHFNDPDQGSLSATARPATEADLSRCVELINRTHQDLDLFRPYSIDYLEQRLNDPAWGPKPSFYPSVYGWDQFRVIESDGEVVACGGLWDRGRDVRERWTKPTTGETHTLAPTALMDFGHTPDAVGVAAMAELISHFLATTATVDGGRSSMMAPLEFSPDIIAACAHLDHNPESRELHVMGFVSPDLTIEATVTRPYTDLAYW